MSKHTPGPWRINGNNKFRWIVADSEVSTHSDDVNRSAYGGNMVCESVHEANARLIAAAPELLEVVQKFVAWSEAERDPSGTTFWQRVEMCREVDALASAAIAKAEGAPK